MIVCRMVKVNNPDSRAAPTINAMFCSKILLVCARSPEGSVRYRLTSVIESPTKLGATTANTLAAIVKNNPSTRRIRYLKRYLLRYCNARNGLKFCLQR